MAEASPVPILPRRNDEHKRPLSAQQTTVLKRDRSAKWDGASVVQTRTHGGNPWELMRRRGCSKEEVLDFSVDVNPLGFPNSLPSIMRDRFEDIRCYPDPSATELREAIATYHQIPINSVLPGNGAAELIGLLAQGRRVKKALVVVPTFSEYEWALEQRDATCVRVETHEANGFRLEGVRDDWRRCVNEVNLAFLCNPNNPTGVAIPKDDVLQLAQTCREAGALLVIDESFAEFVERPDDASVIHEASQWDHVVVLRSLTKCFAIPGLRLGYLVACPSLVEELRGLQQPWPLNTIALAVGAHLFKETDYLTRSRRVVAELREELQRALGMMPGLRPFPSATNFILCKLTTPAMTSAELCDRLVHRHILIRNCDSFTGLESGRFIRVAVRTHAENTQLLTALREILGDAS